VPSLSHPVRIPFYVVNEDKNPKPRAKKQTAKRKAYNPSHLSASTLYPQTHARTHLLVLPGRAPHVLEEPVALGKTVQRVIALAHGADEAAQSVVDGLAGVAAVLVNLSDRDLDGRVVLGLDDAVGGAALARDVART
jgi:hypothetical protein